MGSGMKYISSKFFSSGSMSGTVKLIISEDWSAGTLVKSVLYFVPQPM